MSANETRTRVTTVFNVNEGDEVVATKGDNVLRVKVRLHDGYRVLDVGPRVAAPRLASFIDAGYTVEKITPKPPTPTEPGHYTDNDGRDWLRLTGGYAGQSWIAWDGGRFTPEAAERSFGPFTRVVPAPALDESLAKVIDREGDTWTRNADGTFTFRHLTKTLEQIKANWAPVKNTEGVIL